MHLVENNTSMQKIRIEKCDHHQIIDLLGGIYEHSPWVAEQLYAEGISDADNQVERLASRMEAIVEATDDTAKLALLCAHPELAGRLAIAGDLTAESTAEQASAGLDKCTEAEFAQFSQLNAAYQDRFNHPFIIAVRGLTRADILAAFQTRIDNDPQTEFATALAEVHKIARLRLEQLL